MQVPTPEELCEKLQHQAALVRLSPDLFLGSNIKLLEDAAALIQQQANKIAELSAFKT
jgi:hypothetical protein